MEFHDVARTPALLERIAGLGFVEVTIEEGKRKSSPLDVRAFAGPHAN
jgi:hypothetical protein